MIEQHFGFELRDPHVVQIAAAVGLEDLAHTLVVHVTLHEEREEEAGVEEDQSRGSL